MKSILFKTCTIFLVLPIPPRKHVESTPKTQRQRLSPRKSTIPRKISSSQKQKPQLPKSRSRSGSPLQTRSPSLQLVNSGYRSPSLPCNSYQSPTRSPTPSPRGSPRQKSPASSESFSSEIRLVNQRKELRREERKAYQESFLDSLSLVKNKEKSSTKQFPMPEGRKYTLIYSILKLRNVALGY